MNGERESVRPLADDPAAGPLGDVLREARQDLPDDASVARVAAALGLGAAAATGVGVAAHSSSVAAGHAAGATGVAAGAGAAGAGLLAKTLLALGSLGAGIAATFAFLSGGPPDPAAEAARVPAADPAPVVEAPTPAPVPADPAPAPEPPAPEAPAVAAGEPRRAPATQEPAPRPRREPAPVEGDEGDAPIPSELSLLIEARQATRAGQGAGALAILDRLDDAHPGGAYAQERALLRARALVAAGRAAEARALAERFLRRHPASPYRDPFQALLRSLPAPGPAP